MGTGGIGLDPASAVWHAAGIRTDPEVPFVGVSAGAATISCGMEGRWGVNNVSGLGSDARPKIGSYPGKRCENVNEWR